MKNPGGYQLVDFKGTVLNLSSAVVVESAEIANILRNTQKVVYISGLELNSIEMSGIVTISSNIGAVDGKGYSLYVGSLEFDITTDDNKVTITPKMS